jgi:hypothetical protein
VNKSKRNPQVAGPDEQGSVSDWSDIIRRQGEEARKRDDEQLKGLEESVALKTKSLPSTEAAYLVRELRTYAGWGSHDPRQTIEMQKYVDAVEAELLKRVAS